LGGDFYGSGVRLGKEMEDDVLSLYFLGKRENNAEGWESNQRHGGFERLEGFNGS
jgi:hypothetical protein